MTPDEASSNFERNRIQLAEHWETELESEAIRTEARPPANGPLSPPPPLTVRLDDFLDEKPLSVKSILGDGVISAGTLNLFSGESGSGKTTILANAAIALAQGKPFLGLDAASGAVSILFLEAEGNRDRFRERVRTACGSHGVSPKGLSIFFHRRGVRLAIDVPELERMIRETTAQLVILDPVGQFYEGDENATRDWRRSVVKPLRLLIETTGAAFILPEHHVKPNEFRRGRHRIRGTGSKVDDADTAMMLDASKSARAERVLSFPKIRNGPDVEAMALHLDLERATVKLTDEDPLTLLKPRLGEIQKLVLARGPIETANLIAALGEDLDLGRSQAEDLIASARRLGLITRVKRGVYAVPGALFGEGPTA